MVQKSKGWFALAAILWVVSIALYGQTNFGSITGVVKDSGGGVVPGAEVKVVDAGTHALFKATTDASGVYSIPSLRPVTYEVSATAKGFQTTTVKDVKIDTSRTFAVDIVLKPGSITETVTVTSDAPLLEAASGAVSQTVNARQMEDTPLNGRNVIELALTLPGVAGDAGSEFAPAFNAPPLPGREISINGGRAGSAQFTADGMNVTSVGLARTSVSFSPDTIQEFSVLESNYSAAYSVAGGGIIQQTTKSGTNDYRGTAYWFHRQKALSANPFNSTRQAQFDYDNRPPLRRQQFGLVVGGPVVIPKVYNGNNKTFFFASYEPTRQVAGLVGGASFIRVPTDLEIKGDFSQSYTYDAAGVQRAYPLLYNHFTRDGTGTLHYLPNPNYNPSQPASAANPMYAYTFNNSIFNPGGTGAALGHILVDSSGKSMVNPASANIARTIYPRPAFDMITSGANAGSNYADFNKTYNVDDRFSGRVDQYIGDKHRLFARYSYQPLYGNRQQYSLTGNPGTSDTSLSNNVIVSVSSTIRPTIVNEFRAGAVWSNFSRNFPANYLNTDGTTPLLDLGGPGRGTPNPLGFGLANFMKSYAPANNARSFGEMGQNGVQNIGRNSEASFSLSNALHWVRGGQTWSFGIDANQLQSNAAASGYGYQAGGVFTQSGNITNDGVGCTVSVAVGGNALPTDCHSATARTGDNFASFLLGVPGNPLMYENIAQPYYYRWMNAGLYAQNDWKVTSSLTINVGVRWQYQSPRWEKYNRQGQLNTSKLEPNPFVLDAAGKPLPAPVFEFSGLNGRSRYLTPAHHRDFEPRFGFAWVPDFGFNTHRTIVVRGGYGISHSPLTGNSRQPFPNLGSKLDAFRAYNVAFGTTDIFNPGNQGGCGVAICDSSIPMQFGYNNIQFSPDPTLFNLPSNGMIRPGDIAANSLPGNPVQDKRYSTTGFVFDQSSVNPMVQSFSFQIQDEISKDTVLTVGYQGAHGTHLFSADIDLNNDPIHGTIAFPGYNGTQGGRMMLLNRTGGSSTYNAATVQVKRRFSKGLQLDINYTFSKSIDDGSGGIQYDYANLAGQDSSAQAVRINQPQNSRGTTNERALSSFNVPHVLNISAFYELPLGRGRRFLNHSRLLDLAVGGWEISGLSRFQSGLPLFTDLGNANNIGLARTTGLSNPRPNVIPGVPLVNPDWNSSNYASTPYLNPRAFAVPEPGTFGNAPRNFSVQAPRRQSFDFSLFKDIHLFRDSRKRLQLRGEFYNVLNRKNFGFTGGTQTSLFNNLNQNLAGNPNRYANLSPTVWTAILKKDPSSLPGATTAPAGGILSPLGVYTELSGYFNSNYYNLDPNVTNPRIVQLALKFYF